MSKFIELDTTLAAPNDTLEIDVDKYDNAGNWIFEEDVSAINGYADITDSANKITNTNYWNGSSVPYLTVTNEYSGGVLDYTYNDYLQSYSAQGELLKDSPVFSYKGIYVYQ